MYFNDVPTLVDKAVLSCDVILIFSICSTACADFNYPFNYVLPTGDMFVWSNTYGEIIKPQTGATVSALPRWIDNPIAKVGSFPA